MRELVDQIETMKARWMTGGDAICPDGWSSALGERPNVSLIALAGQFTRVATRPTASDELVARAPLPRLALPVLAGDLRPLFRRVLDGKIATAGPVLALLAARGVTAHPADWMPSASTEAPDVYGPWIDWVAADSGTSEMEVELTAENWDDWWPNARRLALIELRRHSPDAARALIAAKAGDLPAEQRVRLVAVLRDGLSEHDIDVLDSLANDRSGKVKIMVRNMLAQLNRTNADPDKLAELADFFELQKAGMLSRMTVLVAKKLKTNVQRKRRGDLAEVLPLAAFAKAFEMTADDLIDSFDLSTAPEVLIDMTVASGTAEQAARLMNRVSQEEGLDDADLQPLTERLDPNHRRKTALQLLARDNQQFQRTCDALDPKLGSLPADPLLAAPAFSTLMKHLQKDDGRVQSAVTKALLNLGLLADAEAADRLLRHFTSAGGLMAADPRLALLRLNVALKETP